MGSKRVFISRDLKSDSDFGRMLQANGFQVVGQSLIDFIPMEVNTLPDTNWVFFYSKNAVRYYLSSLEKSGLDIDGECAVAAIGPATAKMLENRGLKVDFVGDGDPESTAAQFLSLAFGKSVLFPRAKNSRKSVQDLLLGHIHIVDLIVYDNKPKESIKELDQEILVFTSPLNVKAYFSEYSLQDYQKVIAIGNTTANALKKCKIKKVAIASKPSEKSLAEKVMEVDRGQ